MLYNLIPRADGKPWTCTYHGPVTGGRTCIDCVKAWALEVVTAEAHVRQAIRRHDRDRRRRFRRTLTGRLFLWLLDQAELHTTQLCAAYGGPGPEDTTRLCDKTRWHWDSHSYGRWQRPDGSVLDPDEWRHRTYPWAVTP